MELEKLHKNLGKLSEDNLNFIIIDVFSDESGALFGVRVS
jgi:hypothetical protein